MQKQTVSVAAGVTVGVTRGGANNETTREDGSRGDTTMSLRATALPTTVLVSTTAGETTVDSVDTGVATDVTTGEMADATVLEETGRKEI